MAFSKYTLRMPNRLKIMLEEISRKMGISVNALILQAVWEFVTEKKKINPVQT